MSYYDDLGVKPGAAPEEIRAAFRRKASRHHPDRKGGDLVLYQVIQRAYDTLVDPERRKRYDQHGEEVQSGSLREKAMQQLALMLGQMITNPQVPLESTDILDMARANITSGQNKIPEQRRLLERALARLETARKRMRVKRGQNLIGAMIDHQIATVKTSIGALAQERELGEEMRRILSDFEYRVDEGVRSFFYQQ